MIGEANQLPLFCYKRLAAIRAAGVAAHLFRHETDDYWSEKGGREAKPSHGQAGRH